MPKSVRDAKECGKNVSIELFEEGYPEEATEPLRTSSADLHG